MGARSETRIVGHPYPVVFDALTKCLPAYGYTITAADLGRGRVSARKANTTLELAVGAIDAITTEWQATAQLRIGLFRERHDEHFAAIGDALDTYLATYYV